MVFSSLTFLGLFFPAVLLLYFTARGRAWRNAVLLLASLVFYAWGEPVYILAMLGITLVDYVAARLLFSRQAKAGAKTGKGILALAIGLNLALLFAFKYYNFAMENLGALLHVTFPRLNAAMPIGISFFTFQSMSYVIDVYRGDVRLQKNYAKVLLYVSLFPQLIAGPIVRYADVAEEIDNRVESYEGVAEGGARFAVGLAKKVILANYSGELATALLSTRLSTLSVSGAWLGMAMFTLQIYFDFSGYSDMAIGLGRIFGFRFKENFNYPYISRSVTEFWRRWHISLSSFFRDYVYIPLGGNRKRQYLNILIVWLLTGLWHGASWNFLLWGLYYALLLMAEKALGRAGIRMERVPVLSNLALLVIVMLGWALFYYTDFAQLGIFFQRLVGAGGAELALNIRERSAAAKILYLMPVMVVAVTPYPARLGRLLRDKLPGAQALEIAFCLGLLLLSCLLLLRQTYNPFLYFRF